MPDNPEIQTAKNTKRQFNRLLLAFAATILVIVGGLTWLYRSYSELRRHITPGSNVHLTTSTEPYDVVFRAAIKGGLVLDKSAPPMEWRLRLPRTYVTMEDGENGAVNRWSRDGKDEYFVDFDANLAADGKSLVPSVGKPHDELIKNSFIFHLSNDEAIREIRNYEGCVPSSLEKDVLGPRGFVGAHNQQCYDQILRCTIYMHADGWNIDLAVTKDLYSQPAKTCQLAHEFLDKYTVKRDDIR
jgi:hypothetical protein